jgi:hypothetical protein
MLEKGQNWELFGYDMRHLGRYWMTAWRDVLWAPDSPVRQRLDEIVTLEGVDGSDCYQAGRVCSAATASECRAILLPDEQVLWKKIEVPVAAATELPAIVALEVRASSPFAAEDTRFGWNVVNRGDTQLQVALAIVSASGTMAYLGRAHDIHDIHAREVWVDVQGDKVVIQGFGEALREQRYRRRLLHSAGLLGAIAVLLLVVVGVSAAFKGAELRRLEAMSVATAREAGEASRLRSALAVANETISAANEVVARYPNPHSEIARLSKLLDDNASITSFSMAGPTIRLRGRASDAAQVMEELTDEPAYREVLAPQAIAKLGNSGQEQFYLNITLDTGAQQ